MITQVEALKIAREALERAKYAIKGREHTGFIDSALAALATVSDAQPVASAKWREYMKHKSDCLGGLSGNKHPCVCGLEAVLSASPTPDVRPNDLKNEIDDLRKRNAALKSKLEMMVKIGNDLQAELNQLDPARQRHIDQCMGKS